MSEPEPPELPEFISPHSPVSSLFKHQREALDAAKNKKAFAFLMEMGTGKTKTTIQEIVNLRLNAEIDTVLIIAPKGVYTAWLSLDGSSGQLIEHMPADVRSSCRMAIWKTGNVASMKKAAALADDQKYRPFLRILVLNIEALRTSDELLRIAEKMAADSRGSYIVVDESTIIKNPKSLSAKSCVRLRKVAPDSYRRILTGSPVTKSPVDLFSQFEFLGEGLLGHRSIQSFRGEYLIEFMLPYGPGGRLIKKEMGTKNLDRLAAVLKQHSFRVLKKDCLDLPPKLYSKRFVELSVEQKKAYESLKRTAFAQIRSGQITTAIQLTLLLRLHQLTCGSVTLDDGTEEWLGDARLAEVENILDESSSPVIIWGTYRNDLSRLSEALRKKLGNDQVVEYHGGVSQENRQKAVEAFQTKHSRVFLGNQQTAGRGITLHAAETVVYYSNNFSLEHRLQSEDRAHRIGLEHPVNYIDLISPDTVDEKIVQTLCSNRDVADAILQDGLEPWL